MPQLQSPTSYGPQGGDAQTGPMGIRPFTPRPRPNRPAPPTTSQIQDFVLGQGWANGQGVTNPRAIYDEAQRRNISATALDQAGAPLGWQPGTVANYVQQQGWDPLRNRSGDARTGPVGIRPFTPPGARSSAVPNDPRLEMGAQPRPGLTDALYGQRMRRGG